MAKNELTVEINSELLKTIKRLRGERDDALRERNTLRAELATRNSQNDELYKHTITAVNHLRAICYETDAAGPEIIAAERWLAGQIDTALAKVAT